jgi:cell division protein ZapA
MSQHTVAIQVANKSFKIACPVGEESALLAAANELTIRLNKVNEKAGASSEQAMLMAALNLSYDLLQEKESAKKEKQALQSKIDLLKSTIEQAFTPSEAEKY